MYYPKQIPYLLDKEFREDIEYKEYNIKELEDYCMCIWTMKSKKVLNKTISNNILPDACIDIVIDFANSTICFAGFSKETKDFKLDKKIDYMGVRLKPSIFYLLFNIVADKVMDNEIFFSNIEKEISIEELKSQLQYELDIIKQMGYVDYFLIVWDFIRFAREQDIAVGPGRGSAAGSIVAYTLAITNIDPLRYNLIFERFLNPERVTMPDIDIDFCVERRQEVIDYVSKKYGKDRVVQIVTFGTLAARGVIRDVGRVMDS